MQILKLNINIGKFDARSDEVMFLVYSLKCKAYRCYNQRTNTIVEYANVKVEKNIRVKERMLDYNSDEEEEYSKLVRENIKVFFETNNDLQNDVQIIEQGKEKIFEPKEEERLVTIAVQEFDKELPC